LCVAASPGSAESPIDKSPSMASNFGLTRKARVATAIAEPRGPFRATRRPWMDAAMQTPHT
jgi:hypothetical protein